MVLKFILLILVSFSINAAEIQRLEAMKVLQYGLIAIFMVLSNSNTMLNMTLAILSEKRVSNTILIYQSPANKLQPSLIRRKPRDMTEAI